jgi:Domain of unknown function (DUF4268)
MPIFQVTAKELRPISETTFGGEGIMERNDLQRMLRDQISVLDERLMVIAEEFGDWLNSSRRIDLLCIDSEANLVVVELKRTEDGGHMELQALRYAAMVSAMTFDQLVDTFARYRSKAQPNIEGSKNAILEFLGWEEVYEDQFAQDTRIVLAAADFSKELTTAVMWLIERGIDIRCVRMKPYRMGDGTVLLDVQQLIPLSEATDFQTQIGVKKQAERQSRTDRHELRLKFWEGLLELAKTKSDVHANRKPTSGGWLGGGINRFGFSLTYTTRRTDSQVELWIAHGTGQSAKNKAAFKALQAQKSAIEDDFGAPLDWQELPDGEGCRIRYVIAGGYKSPTDQWPAIQANMVEAMVRLDDVMRQRVAQLTY